MPSGLATFGALRCAHQTGIRFYKLDRKIFTFSVKKGFFRTPGLPARIEANLPSACIVAAVAGVANHFAYGPFTASPLSHHNEPFMPSDRTCDGGAMWESLEYMGIAQSIPTPCKTTYDYPVEQGYWRPETRVHASAVLGYPHFLQCEVVLFACATLYSHSRLLTQSSG